MKWLLTTKTLHPRESLKRLPKIREKEVDDNFSYQFTKLAYPRENLLEKKN